MTGKISAGLPDKDSLIDEWRHLLAVESGSLFNSPSADTPYSPGRELANAMKKVAEYCCVPENNLSENDTASMTQAVSRIMQVSMLHYREIRGALRWAELLADAAYKALGGETVSPECWQLMEERCGAVKTAAIDAYYRIDGTLKSIQEAESRRKNFRVLNGRDTLKQGEC